MIVKHKHHPISIFKDALAKDRSQKYKRRLRYQQILRKNQSFILGEDCNNFQKVQRQSQLGLFGSLIFSTLCYYQAWKKGGSQFLKQGKGIPTGILFLFNIVAIYSAFMGMNERQRVFDKYFAHLSEEQIDNFEYYVG